MRGGAENEVNSHKDHCCKTKDDEVDLFGGLLTSPRKPLKIAEVQAKKTKINPPQE